MLSIASHGLMPGPRLGKTSGTSHRKRPSPSGVPRGPGNRCRMPESGNIRWHYGYAGSWNARTFPKPPYLM
jgi:hypothetical protein